MVESSPGVPGPRFTKWALVFRINLKFNYSLTLFLVLCKCFLGKAWVPSQLQSYCNPVKLLDRQQSAVTTHHFTTLWSQTFQLLFYFTLFIFRMIVITTRLWCKASLCYHHEASFSIQKAGLAEQRANVQFTVISIWATTNNLVANCHWIANAFSSSAWLSFNLGCVLLIQRGISTRPVSSKVSLFSIDHISVCQRLHGNIVLLNTGND